MSLCHHCMNVFVCDWVNVVSRLEKSTIESIIMTSPFTIYNICLQIVAEI